MPSSMEPESSAHSSPISFWPRATINRSQFCRSVGLATYALTVCAGQPASLTALSSTHLLFKSSVPECAEVMKGFEELIEGRKRWGKSHSGTLRMRYSIHASSPEEDSRRPLAKEEGWDKKLTASRACAIVNPRWPRSWVILGASVSERTDRTMSLASGYKEIPYRNLNQKGTLGIDGNTTNLLNRIFYQLSQSTCHSYFGGL